MNDAEDYASFRKYLDRKPDFKMKVGVDSDDPYAGQTDTERFKTRRAQELNDGLPSWPQIDGLFGNMVEALLDSMLEPVRELPPLRMPCCGSSNGDEIESALGSNRILCDPPQHIHGNISRIRSWKN